MPDNGDKAAAVKRVLEVFVGDIPKATLGSDGLSRFADHVGRVRADVVREAWVAPEETFLWLAVVEAAVDDATRLGKAKIPYGETWNPTAATRERIRQTAELREFIDGNHPGSLAWIADHLSATTGEDLSPEPVRRRILDGLAGSAGDRKRRDRAAARGNRRVAIVARAAA